MKIPHAPLSHSVHSLVTSDLAFFKESLKSLNACHDLDRNLDDLWKIVNELRSNRGSPSAGRKADRGSPSTGRKASIQR